MVPRTNKIGISGETTENSASTTPELTSMAPITSYHRPRDINAYHNLYLQTGSLRYSCSVVPLIGVSKTPPCDVTCENSNSSNTKKTPSC